MKFKTIIADPPWNYEVWSDKGKERTSPNNHYDVMSFEDICSLRVADIADTDCTLLLWTTSPFLARAVTLVERWGFSYKSCLYWVKMSRRGVLHIGCGYHSRACVEPLIIATKGSPPAPVTADRGPSALFVDEGILLNGRGRHSAKPDQQYEIAERYPGPYVEIFSRFDGGLCGDREGWTFLGNEISGNDIRVDLAVLSGTKE
jgi:N6-adenosine-specific RNA methylase IME4